MTYKTKNTFKLLAIVGLLFFAQFAFAASPVANGRNWQSNNGYMGVFGTVTAINGTTITLHNNGFGSKPIPSTYTVDASNATVLKAGSTTTLSAVQIGDNVMALGAVSGNSVVATTLRDNMTGRVGVRPQIIGVVASINGPTLTVNSKEEPNNSSTAYTVDASKATITKNGSDIPLSSIAVGDTVMVDGAVTGNSVVASSIRDGLPPQAGQNPHWASSTPGHGGNGIGSFFSNIGNFFRHLFGFK